ncbi:AMP-binding protein [Candidatus Dependentiae bacterium]
MHKMQCLKKIKSVFSKSAHRKEEELFAKIKKSFSKDNVLIYAGSLLSIAYQKYPDSTALISGSKTINYKELYFRSVQLSYKLQEAGVKKRDKVVLHMQNSEEFYISYFAIWQLGAIVVPLNIFLHEKELTYIIKDCQPKVVIASDTLKIKWNNIKGQKKIENSPIIFDESFIDWKCEVPQKIQDVYPDFTVETLEQDELCLLLYTSGTTGAPKGVMLSSKNILTNTMQSYARLCCFGQNKFKKDRFFAVLPLFHVFAQNTCLWLPVMIGASIIIVKKIDRKLILQGLYKKPTLFFGFPALYGLLCLLKTAKLDSIRVFISGADMLPDKIRHAFAVIYGRKICSGYGLTEASPAVAFNLDNHTKPTQVVGDPLVGIECDIRDDQQNSLERGKIGTLWIRGDNIMMGYYNSEQATKEVIKDGWLNTGDLASFDSEWKLAIQGRSKDLIIHKGFNIYPQEVENILMTHPSVFKAAVVGKEESVLGQVPIAFVAVKSMTPDIQNSLREICICNLALYKIPKKFICLDDLPMNATGKVDKKQLEV